MPDLIPLPRTLRHSLRRARMDAGMTASHLSLLVDRAPNYVQRLESYYVAMPSLDVAYRLSRVLGRPMRELFPEVFEDCDAALDSVQDDAAD
jgi:transcriptional regulator with XRE-family HTH domain